MATVLGALLIRLGLDSGQFSSGLSAAQKQLKKTEASFAQVGSRLQGIGASFSIGLTAPITAAAAAAVQGAQEQAAALAQVNAALASMGPVAGRTSEQLLAASDALELRSLANGDEILRKVTANLLTFGNISGTTFDRAQQAALDLSARLGTDLQGSAIQVGKALNDPVKGVSALQRVGVSFTAAQKEQIEAMVAAGNAAGAQSLILGELEKQFGGAAQAAANTDPWRKAEVALGQAGDKIGEALLPLIPPLADAVVNVAQAFGSLSPQMQTFTLGAAAVGAALGPVLIGVGAMVSGVGALLPALAAVGPAFTAMSTALAAVRVAALAALPALTPFLIPLGAITVAVGAAYLAWRNWDKIKPIINRVVGWASQLYQGIKTWLVDRLAAVWRAVTAPIEAVKRQFRDLYVAVVGNSYVPDMVTEIGQHMARLDTEMVGRAGAATKATGDTFRKLRDEIAPILERLYPEQARANQFAAELEMLDDRMRRLGFSAAQLADARERLSREFLTGSAIEQVAAPMIEAPLANVDIEGLLNTPATRAAQAVVEQWARIGEANKDLQDSFGNTVRNITQSLRGLVDGIRNGDFLDVLTGVVDLLTGLGGAGVFGGKVRASVNGFGGARALGGPVLSGKSYLVGERGPELFTPSRSGMIVPNDQLGGPVGQSVVQLVVEEGSLLRPTIRQVSGEVAVEVVSTSNAQQARAARQRIAR